ncbi:MAG: LUD domain-containing protein [Gammaproteobacteria bacterium]
MTTIKDDREAVLALLSANKPPPDDMRQKHTAETAATSALTTPPPDVLLRRFCIAAKNNAATIAEVGGLENVPSAAAAYMRDNNIPPKLLCSPSLAKLDWQNAKLSAECRPATSDDHCAITDIIAAAADTGAMLVSNQTPYQLTHSLLPPMHIATFPADAIVADLPNVWRRMQKAKDNSLIASLFCGPSRTGDIEQTITLGAHGPLRVHLIIYKGA